MVCQTLEKNQMQNQFVNHVSPKYIKWQQHGYKLLVRPEKMGSTAFCSDECKVWNCPSSNMTSHSMSLHFCVSVCTCMCSFCREGASKVLPLNKRNKFNYTAVWLYLFPGAGCSSLRAFNHLPARYNYNSPEVVSAGLFTLCQIIVSLFSGKRTYPVVLKREKLDWASMQAAPALLSEKSMNWVHLE